MQNPLVSIILPVYNGADYVGSAIESLLAQSFRDFELIALNDGSKDNTLDVLSAFKDPRVQVVSHANRGLAATLNRGLELARGRYIARQDHDDLSLTTRIEKQVAFLERNPECALLGAWAKVLEGDKQTDRLYQYATDNGELQLQLLHSNPFVHTSVMFRKSIVEDIGYYSTDPRREPPEDYELWTRVARKHRVANIGEPLVWYREIPTSIQNRRAQEIRERATLLHAEQISYWSTGSTQPTEAALDFARLLTGMPSTGEVDFRAITIELYDAVGAIARRFGSDRASLDRQLKKLLQRIEFAHLSGRYGPQRAKLLRFRERLVRRYWFDRNLLTLLRT